MPNFDVTLFAANNFTNPQNPGFLPSEDSTFLSDLENGDQMTWLGGGESAIVTITDNVDTTFDEAQSNQTLQSGLTFDGVTYVAGQVVTPTYTIIFSGSDGNSYTLTSFNFSPNTDNEIPDATFWEGSIPPSGTVLTVTSELNPTGGGARDYNDFVTCFCTGTLIDTKSGQKAIEDLEIGDLIRCEDGSYAEIRMIPHRHISSRELNANPKLRPIKITAGALGCRLPLHDTWVSRQHRMYVSSLVCRRMFGTDAVLVAAIKLTDLPGIYVDEDMEDVTYWHLVLSQHEIIFANSAPSESFLVGENAIEALSREAQEELSIIFHNLHTLESAYFIPSGKLQKQLISRHLRNEKPLLTHSWTR
ncbi:MAG: Hint domain-containing protein [Litoreibacter sp.]